MKQWFVWALVALMVVGVQAGEEGTSAEQKKARGLAAVDTDKDGKVSLQEYTAFQQKKAEKAGNEFDAEQAEADFEAKDKDEDGFLSKAEMAPKNRKKKTAEQDDADKDDQE